MCCLELPSIAGMLGILTLQLDIHAIRQPHQCTDTGRHRAVCHEFEDGVAVIGILKNDVVYITGDMFHVCCCSFNLKMGGQCPPKYISSICMIIPRPFLPEHRSCGTSAHTMSV